MKKIRSFRSKSKKNGFWNPVYIYRGRINRAFIKVIKP